MTAFAAISPGPQVSTVWSDKLTEPSLTLDAKHYQKEFVLALAKVHGCGFPTTPLGELASAFVAPRTKLITVPNARAGAPYLRAHDAFEVRPHSRRFLVRARTDGYDDYLLRKGMLLTPSSGRNLGPVAFVGEKMARFAMTDIVRIVPKTESEGYYLLAYLLTPTGQALIRRGRTGTTVDHFSADDALSIAVVHPSNADTFARVMKVAESTLDRARLKLDALEAELHELVGLSVSPPNGRYFSSTPRAFTTNSTALTLRVDAAFYDPAVKAARSALEKAGATALADVADLRLLGRYKRYYVAGPRGRPILSGRHLLQLRPVNLRNISDRSFKDPESFIIRKGWTLFTCDGRAEEQLGSPAYVHSGWDGWMASNHVMRAIPRIEDEGGFLYLALRSPYVQRQMKARATGSVIDGLDPETVADVLLPAPSARDRKRLSAEAAEAWEGIAAALRDEDAVVAKLESTIANAYEKRSARGS
jgi:hypothetical protein